MRPEHHKDWYTPQAQPRAVLNTIALAPRKRSSSGFTLIEMLIVLVIFGILLLIAAPAYQQMIRNNRMVSEVYALRAVINNARSEAIARRFPVAVCPTTNGTACAASNDWTTGYMSFIDADADDTVDAGEEIIQVNQFDSAEEVTAITFDNGNQRIRFSPQGTAINSAGTFTFCDDRGAEDASAMILNAVGSLRAAIDTDGTPDDIVNDAGGTNVSC